MPTLAEERELNRMIQEMRHQLGLGPCGRHVPENVTDDPPRYGDPDPEGWLAAQQLRAELIAKIERSPRWREKWYASQSLLLVRPWEFPPWVDWAAGPALRLRKQLKAAQRALRGQRRGPVISRTSTYPAGPLPRVKRRPS